MREVRLEKNNAQRRTIATEFLALDTSLRLLANRLEDDRMSMRMRLEWIERVVRGVRAVCEARPNAAGLKHVSPR